MTSGRIVFPGFQILDLTGPHEVFAQVERLAERSTPALAARIADRTTAEAIQLAIEYDPQPPFDAGSLVKAPQAAKDLLAAGFR